MARGMSQPASRVGGMSTSEARKGVQVDDFSSMGRSFHAGATDVEVTDGHLFVTSEDGDTVAVYAPGKWKSAVIEK